MPTCCSNEALHIGDHDLQVFLKALHNQLETVALHPDPQRMVGVAVAPQPVADYNSTGLQKQC
jgi:hypothetical protein